MNINAVAFSKYSMKVCNKLKLMKLKYIWVFLKFWRNNTLLLSRLVVSLVCHTHTHTPPNTHQVSGGARPGAGEAADWSARRVSVARVCE